MFKVSKILFFLAISSGVFAESYTAANGLKVTSVFAGYENGEAFFEVNGAAVNPASCGGTPIAVDATRSNAGQVLSVLLYAHAAGKTVDLHIYDESCLGGHRVLRRIKVNSQ